MSEDERLEYKEELYSYSKEEMIEKYIDEIEENTILTNQWYKSTQKIKKAIEYIKNKKQFQEGCDIYQIIDWNYVLEILGDKE